MFGITNRLVAGAVAAAGLCSAALALSATASADPATPANPGLPGLNIVQQLASSPASAVTGLIQSAEAALTGAPAALTGAPAAPTASAALNLPQQATPPPGATASITLPQPAATAPVTNAAGTAPTGQLGLPNFPGLPQVPTNLAGLLPGGLLPNLAAQPAAAATNTVEAVPAGTSAPAQNPIAALLPLSALP